MATASSKPSNKRTVAPTQSGARSQERKRRNAAEAVAVALGRRFEKPNLLDEALTHASASSQVDSSNERMEFLGDRILGLLTADALYARFPNAPEGALAARFNALVRKETCAEIAEKIGVGPALKLGRSEARSGGRKKEALLADAMEALIAAVYLDGGLAAAAETHHRLWGPLIESQMNEAAPRDPKTALQEWAQGRGQPLPRYELVDRSGPAHEPSFRVAARLESGMSAEATAPTKRGAEREAAATLLKQLRDAET